MTRRTAWYLLVGGALIVAACDGAASTGHDAGTPGDLRDAAVPGADGAAVRTDSGPGARDAGSTTSPDGGGVGARDGGADGGTTELLAPSGWEIVAGFRPFTWASSAGANASDVFAVANGGQLYHFDGVRWQRDETFESIRYADWPGGGTDPPTAPRTWLEDLRIEADGFLYADVRRGAPLRRVDGRWEPVPALDSLAESSDRPQLLARYGPDDMYATPNDFRDDVHHWDGSSWSEVASLSGLQSLAATPDDGLWVVQYPNLLKVQAGTRFFEQEAPPGEITNLLSDGENLWLLVEELSQPRLFRRDGDLWVLAAPGTVDDVALGTDGSVSYVERSSAGYALVRHPSGARAMLPAGVQRCRIGSVSADSTWLSCSRQTPTLETELYVARCGRTACEAWPAGPDFVGVAPVTADRAYAWSDAEIVELLSGGAASRIERATRGVRGMIACSSGRALAAFEDRVEGRAEAGTWSTLDATPGALGAITLRGLVGSCDDVWAFGDEGGVPLLSRFDGTRWAIDRTTTFEDDLIGPASVAATDDMVVLGSRDLIVWDGARWDASEASPSGCTGIWGTRPTGWLCLRGSLVTHDRATSADFDFVHGSSVLPRDGLSAVTHLLRAVGGSAWDDVWIFGTVMDDSFDGDSPWADDYATARRMVVFHFDGTSLTERAVQQPLTNGRISAVTRGPGGAWWAVGEEGLVMRLVEE